MLGWFLFNLITLLVFTFLFLSKTFAIGGINPNLPLVFFALFFVFFKGKNKFLYFLLFLVIFFLILYYSGGGIFLWRELLLFASILIILFFVNKFFTGHWYIDGIILVAIFCLLFYGIKGLIFGSPFLIAMLIKEIIYDYLIFVFFGLLYRIRNTI